MVKEKLPIVVIKLSAFKDLMHILYPHEKSAVIPLFASKFSVLIDSIDDFVEIMQVLMPEQAQCMICFDAVKEKLPQLLRSVEDFNAVIVLLPPDERMVFFEASKARLAQLVLAGSETADFNTLRRAVLQSIQFMYHFVEELQSIPAEDHTEFESLTRFPDHLKDALKNLTGAEIKALTHELKRHLPAEFNLEEMIAVCRPKGSIQQSFKRGLDETHGAAEEAEARPPRFKH